MSYRTNLFWAVALCLVLSSPVYCQEKNKEAAQEPLVGDATDFPIIVRNPTILPTELPCKRVKVGNCYKPSMVKLNSGELLISAFRGASTPKGDKYEEVVAYRSSDNGLTWSKPKPMGVIGRESELTVVSDGTLFSITRILPKDARNPLGYLHSYINRSTDGGHTWQTTPITTEDVPGAVPNGWIFTSRNVLEMRDGTLAFEVHARGQKDYLWRSHDRGLTWDRSLKSTFEGVSEKNRWRPMVNEEFLWQVENGDLLGVFRAYTKAFPPIPGTELPTGNDQVDRLVAYRSRNGGAHWTREDLKVLKGADYGEMFPSILRMADKRLLLTFTVRGLNPPLGVHAVLGTEKDDRFDFDFTKDRLVIDYKTPLDSTSGGGYGPTIQLDDGTLITAFSYRLKSPPGLRIEVVRWNLVSKP